MIAMDQKIAYLAVSLLVLVIMVSGCTRGGPRDQRPGLDAPVVSPPSPQAGETFQIAVSATDDTGLTALTIEVGDFTETFACDGEKTCRNTWSRTLQTAGSYQVTVTAVDTANQQETRSATIIIGGLAVCNNNGVCDAGETTASCPADCPLSAAARFGVVLSGSGGQIVRQKDIGRDVVPVVVDASVEAVRIFNLGWEKAEPVKGQFDWALADESIRPFSDNGVSPLVTLFSNSKWGTQRSAVERDEPVYSAIPLDWSDYEHYVREMVTRYKDDVDYWQLENEVYAFTGFWFAGTPADYVAVVNHAYPIIKQVDPTATVVLAGIQSELLRAVSGVEDRGLDAATLEAYKDNIRTILRDAQFDAAAVHIYSDYEDIPQQIDWLKAELAAVGRADASIISTEGGGPGGPTDFLGPGAVLPTEQELAQDIVKRYTILFANDVDQFYLFSLAQSQSFPWGIVTPQVVKRASFFTLQQMTEHLGGFTAVDELTLDSGVSAYKYTVGGRPVVVAWSDAGQKTINLNSVFSRPTVSMTEFVTETDGAGNPQIKTAISGPTSSVTLTETPVFIE